MPIRHYKARSNDFKIKTTTASTNKEFSDEKSISKKIVIKIHEASNDDMKAEQYKSRPPSSSF